MSNAEQIKLTKAGDTLTLNVMSCVQVPVGKYPEIEFTGIAGNKLVAVRVNKQSVDRQFTRLDLTHETAVGKVLVFSRDVNPSDTTKPYWGINFGEAQSNTPTPLPVPRPASNVKQGINLGAHIPGLDEPPPPDDNDAPEGAIAPALRQAAQAENPASDRLNALFNLYDVCFDHATTTARKAKDMNPDVAAMAATLFIQVNMKGIAA